MTISNRLINPRTQRRRPIHPLPTFLIVILSVKHTNEKAVVGILHFTLDKISFQILNWVIWGSLSNLMCLGYSLEIRISRYWLFWCSLFYYLVEILIESCVIAKRFKITIIFINFFDLSLQVRLAHPSSNLRYAICTC